MTEKFVATFELAIGFLEKGDLDSFNKEVKHPKSLQKFTNAETLLSVCREALKRIKDGQKEYTATKSHNELYGEHYSVHISCSDLLTKKQQPGVTLLSKDSKKFYITRIYV